VARRTLHVERLGRVRYADAMDLMEARVKARMASEAPDTLFLLEHEHVLTLGRRADRGNIVASPELLAARGVEVFETGRGGDVTYHGPGQLVGYPVIDLAPDRKDVRRYVKDLEEVMIRASGRYGVEAGRLEGLIGTWVDVAGAGRKIGAIGVRISRWITSHGFAFNVSSDMDAFSLIVPCGIRDHGVTSLERELGRTISVDEVMDVVEDAFRDVFDAPR
jgi:lipoyl(octanoyl) transferase